MCIAGYSIKFGFNNCVCFNRSCSHAQALQPVRASVFPGSLANQGTGLGSITIVIDCNRLQLERNRNCNRNQIFQIVV